ncbi:MAG: RIP metalloprotease RseP [Ignavibacteriae bacterium]|nr:RIP metalloprotease RseP [Ignavibacteriota bacterium]
MIFYTAITLGILIVIHELGHFLAAKLTGMRVDRFSIGFPPRAFGKKIGDTDYCISWIPIGGYVKIAGMIDESFDTEFLHREPQSWEFRAKPMWARMSVISAGVIMNVLLAVVIFWGIKYVSGKFVIETTEVGYVVEGSVAEKAGIRSGDKIITINDKPVYDWEEIQRLIYFEHLGRNIIITVERAGRQKNIVLPPKVITDRTEIPFDIVEAHTVALILDVQPDKPAAKLGLKTGDVILSLNDIPVRAHLQVIKIVRSHAGKQLKVTWRRDEQVYSGITTPTDSGRIGTGITTRYTGPFRQIKYSVIQALVAGLEQVVEAPILFIASVRQIIAGTVSFKDSFGGPIKIAQFATRSAEYGILSYLFFLGQLSMMLAILNILPIPALDGGHLIMLIYEKIFRREIPHNVKLAIQQVGFILLLAFMAFIIYNDISSF